MNAHQLSNPTETPLILLLQKKVEVSLFNIDFMKAFDCIEWNFILNLLKARDFGNKWLTGSLSFFSSSKFTILVNITQSNIINCKRGLKQGDPPSPMLFILVVDVLHRMLSLGFANGHFSDLYFRGALRYVRSLQFAGDTLIFCTANRVDITNLKLLLYPLKGISGLILIMPKVFLCILTNFLVGVLYLQAFSTVLW